MSDFSAIFLILIIVLMIVLIWTQFCLMQSNKNFFNKLEINMEKQHIALANIEYVLTGTSQTQGKMSRYETSLKDYLKHSNSRHQDIKLIRVELKWLRQLWEYKNVSSRTKVEDKIFRSMQLQHHQEWCLALGIEGESLTNEMKKYTRLLEKFDKKRSSLDE
jgi:hypothetical protein